MAQSLDLKHFEVTDPHVLFEGRDLDKVRYDDLNYSSRIRALLACTRDQGRPILKAELFNDLLNGRRSLGAVMRFIDHFINGDPNDKETTTHPSACSVL